MKLIGITGRSGCGKSTVTAFFAQKGVPCIDADEISRHIYAADSPLLAAVCEQFGQDLVQGGVLDRRALANRAFATPQGTQALQSITHPEILRRIEQQRQALQAAGAQLCLLDAPVLIGSGLEEQCDKIVVVTAPEELLLKRICERDGISMPMAQRRLNAQLSQEALAQAADYVLENNGTLKDLEQQAEALLELLRRE